MSGTRRSSAAAQTATEIASSARLAMPAGGSNDPLLLQRNSLERQLDAEISPGHHDRVGGFHDPVEMLEGGVFLDLGDQANLGRDDPANRFDVLGPPYKTDADV